MIRKFLFATAFVGLIGGEPVRAASEVLLPVHQITSEWYQSALASMVRKKAYVSRTAQRKKAKNIILFVGDGMGVSTVTAARILDGQQKGLPGEENNLSFDLFTHTALIKTYTVDAQTPDSAGTMTAMMSGVKTDSGVLGVDENVVRGDCSTLKGHELVTALELAELKGKSTGIVTTARVTHATPAATYAKSPERNWEDDTNMPPAVQGCLDIAAQLIDFEDRLKRRYPDRRGIDGLDVVMGGGRRHFLPKQENPKELETDGVAWGNRSDGRNLIHEWRQKYPKGEYVFDQSGLDSIDAARTSKLLALFNESHMHYEASRPQGSTGEPSLSQMTDKAIDILSNNKKGFFLMVEAGRIDHAHHVSNAYNALQETIELSRAVASALRRVNLKETLILVTADHSHVFTLSGYPKRGNPILGKVVPAGSDAPAKALDGLPYTTLGYANGPGAIVGREKGLSNVWRKNVHGMDTTRADYQQDALVPLSGETHGGEDVVLYAVGAGAEYVMGTDEQNLVFHIMNSAAKLSR